MDELPGIIVAILLIFFGVRYFLSKPSTTTTPSANHAGGASVAVGGGGGGGEDALRTPTSGPYKGISHEMVSFESTRERVAKGYDGLPEPVEWLR